MALAKGQALLGTHVCHMPGYRAIQTSFYYFFKKGALVGPPAPFLPGKSPLTGMALNFHSLDLKEKTNKIQIFIQTRFMKFSV